MSTVQMAESDFRAGINYLLKNNDKKQAAALLWPWIQQNEQSDRIWDAIENNSHVGIMGHGSASKSFTCAQWFLLDWWTAPEETGLLITSDTIDSMKRRIWSDMKLLWSKTAVKMPGILVDSKRVIQYSPIDQKNAIAAIAAESKDATSKVQGVHCKRIRVLIDEADNKLSRSVWAAIPNLETSGDFKVVALANPFDRQSDFAKHCMPVGGWDSFNPEIDFVWESKLGWHVLRLDGLQSPNLVLNEDKYPFLLTNKAVASIRKKNGEHSPEWWAYVRAFYPPEGSIHNIFTPDIIAKSKDRHVWYAEAIPCAACDPAFEGGDACILGRGSYGRLASDPKKTVVQAEEFIRIQRKDTTVPITIDFARQIHEKLKQWNVEPKNFVIDCTGNALGLSDYLKLIFGPELLAVGFGGSPTELRITQDDSKKASERFDRFVSELWYVAREWCKLGLAKMINPPVELVDQLESRLYRLIGKEKTSVEKKEDMKKRGPSPDYADTFCLFVHLVRTRAIGFVPSHFDRPEKEKDIFKRFNKMKYVTNLNYGVKKGDS